MTDWSLHFHAIILISPLLWKDIGSQYFSGFGITAPRNVVVQTGLCVHIPCSFKLPSISTISRHVRELSDKPEISPAGRIIVGQEITLSCTSPGICSGLPPSFTWEGKVEMKSEKIYVINNEDGTTIHRSNITFVPSAEDNQLSLTCKVTFESNVTTSSTISLNVEGDLQKVIPMPVCRSIDSGIIAAIAVGNVVILILIFVGTYYFLKRNMEKQSIGKESQSQSQGRESNYQNLNGQESDVYYSLRMH
ncbi:uncharacterized protein [Dendrobates tinctorius]|uniref:uncharacterized protein isoform X2 n=1 Tax=Dendrobates tinctorius TaxID=92724 RepID=UPI003CC93AC4